MSEWSIALLPLGGVVLGAVLQFWLGQTIEKEKRIETLRSQAYADYLRGVAAGKFITSDEDSVAAFRGVADAKARILVYGSPAVITALAKFEEVGPILNNERSMGAFVAVVSSMRPNKALIEDRYLKTVLFGGGREDD